MRPIFLVSITDVCLKQGETRLTMTIPVYHLDPYAKAITARITDARRKDDAYWLLLDQTIFYPGGGGQLPDKGSINGKPLLDIRQKDEAIWHQVALSRDEVATGKVTLELNWENRYYQMQQHTGQHLLSAVLHAHGWPTVSVHLGQEHTLIEVEGPLPDAAQLRQIEAETQQLISRALSVRIHYMEREKALTLPLRRPPKNLGTLRIVEIEEFDYAACGGTHLHSVAEIGLIKILGSEKIRGHARIKALIGARAFQYFEELDQTSALLKEKLNTDHRQFNTRITQLLEELSFLKKQKKFYQSYFIEYESARLAKEFDTPFIVYSLQNGELNDAAELAKKLSKNFGKVAFIQFDRRFFLSSPSAEILDTFVFLKEKGKELELKGGGPQGFCQGVMHRNNLQQIAETIKIYVNQS